MAMWTFPATGTMAVYVDIDSDSFIASAEEGAAIADQKSVNVSNIAVPADGQDTNNYQGFLYKFFYLFGIVDGNAIQNEFTVDYTLKVNNQVLATGN